LELVDVHAGYGTIEALHGVSLSLPPGTVLALLGPNGAGKSTLLKVASGRLEPWSGCVHIAGSHVNGATPEAVARAGVCSIPEGRGIFPNLTVDEHLRMWCFKGGLRAADVMARSYDRFPRLAERRNQLGGQLSGGEQQMLAMSRALSTEPAVLLLDEISLGLAPKIVAGLYRLVAQLAEEGIAILVVEQFARMALSVADSVAIMTKGAVERVGSPDDVSDALSAAYLGVAV
jgi:branched-chain amino acid transport system ATP-binding protein